VANVTRRLGFTQANVKWDSEEQQEWKALPGWSGSRLTLKILRIREHTAKDTSDSCCGLLVYLPLLCVCAPASVLSKD
jgi:hypothetical protein